MKWIVKTINGLSGEEKNVEVDSRTIKGAYACAYSPGWRAVNAWRKTKSK